MAYFFLDDSKHPDFGFALAVSAVFKDNPTERVARLMTARGLVPYRDEFKSSYRMRGDCAMQGLREDLRSVLNDCKLGVCVVPNERELARNAALLLKKMLTHPDLASLRHEIFVDQGICCRAVNQSSMSSIPEASECTFNFEADSREVLGIQLADLAAHTCGLMMKDSLGLVGKCLPAGENSGYDPEMPIELGFSMWASLRYSFLAVPAQDIDWETDSYEKIRTFHAEEYGLVIDPNLSASVANAASSRFASHWLGCIH